MKKIISHFILLLCFFFSSAVQAQNNLTPEDAAKYATLAVSMAEKLEGVNLDYSPNSLKSVDEIILKFHMAGKKPEDMQRAIIVLGCYVGEVMIRNLGGKWEMPNEKARAIGFIFMGVKTKKENFTFPIEKSFKRLINGSEDSVFHLYSVVAANHSK